MNKFTSTLAGLALVAAASIAPALAQDTGTPGNLFTPFGSGTFTFVPGTGAGSGTGDGYNEIGSTSTITTSFTLTSTLVSGTTYSLVSLVIKDPTSATIFTYSPTSNPLFFTYSAVAGTPTSIASLGGDNQGFTFNLVQPVPEASTVVSFGALLALGGLAVLRRKSVKNVS